MGVGVFRVLDVGGAGLPDCGTAGQIVSSTRIGPIAFSQDFQRLIQSANMKPLGSKSLKKKQIIQRAKEAVLLSGARCESVIAEELVKPGWKNLDKLPTKL